MALIRHWTEGEALLGVRSLLVWGVIFFVLNVDFAVVAAGLSSLRLRDLWITAMIARFPWLVVSAWFGDLIVVSDTVMLLALIFMLALGVVLNKLRPRFRHWLVRYADRSDPTLAARSELGERRRATRSGGSRRE